MSHPFITRLESPQRHTYGFYVRVRWRNKLLSRFFSDGVCHGKNKALDAAIQCSKQFCTKLGRPYNGRVINSSTGRRRPLSGRRGVSVEIEDGKIVRYIAFWRPESCVHKTASYPVRKYGRRQALALAISKREAMEKKYYGVVLA
jgi:hypothetical protein